MDKETARKLLAVPLFEAEGMLAVGFHDPQNLNAIDEIELKTGNNSGNFMHERSAKECYAEFICN